MSKRTQTSPFSIRFRPEALEALERAALADGRPTGNLAKKILEDWLRQSGHLKAAEPISKSIRLQ